MIFDGLKILVCGGRDYSDTGVVYRVLDRINATHRVGLIIHGGASGADRIAEAWAKKKQIAYMGIPAEWKTYGNAAGPRRNIRMLEVARPDRVIAFPGGRGTYDMIRKATSFGVTVNTLPSNYESCIGAMGAFGADA